MNAQRITINLSDKAQMGVELFEHKNPRACILMFTAMGVEARYYQHFAEALSKTGFQVLTVDYRGNGLSSVRPKRGLHFGYETIISIDYAEVISFFRNRYPELPIFFLGHSLGGQLSTLFAARHPEIAKGIIQVACSSVFYKNYPNQKRQAWIATRLFDKIARIIGYFPGKTIGFGGKESIGVMRDWCTQGKTGRYDLFETDFDYETALSNLKTPLLTIGVANDHLAPKAAREHLFNKLHPESPKRQIEWSKSNTGRSDLNHFSWAKKPEGLISFFTDWIDEELAS